jgi:Ca-activated chloride channel family protein
MRLKLFRGLLGLLAASLPWVATAAPVQFDLKTDRPVVAEGAASELVLRMNLHADPVSVQRRTPLNLCLVLDKSGSMSGGKIQRLKEAALQAVDRLGKEDVLSIVAFSDGAQVLLRATKLRDRSDAVAAIEHLQADGSTALYAGMRVGLAEVKKFQGKGRVSRILLLSDGLANVGPDSPAALAAVGREAGRMGVPVTTFGLGLGYGEDLMTQLAMASDGNHAFIPDEGGLQAFFDKELGEAFSVAARELVVRITLASGVKVKGSLDREIEQDGSRVTWRLNQLPGGMDKHLLLEVEAPALKAGQSLGVASAELAYNDADGKSQPSQTRQLQIEGGSAVQAEAKVDKDVLGETLEAKANQKREEAITLMDSGDRVAAAKVLQQNSDDLKEAENRYGLSNLAPAAGAYASEAAAMAAPAPDTNSMRKSMKAQSYKEKTQQSY